jgi:hypothetical protein
MSLLGMTQGRPDGLARGLVTLEVGGVSRRMGKFLLTTGWSLIETLQVPTGASLAAHCPSELPGWQGDHHPPSSDALSPLQHPRSKPPSDMIITTVANEPRLLDTDLAESLGYERPRDIRKPITRHQAALDVLGPRTTVERVINGSRPCGSTAGPPWSPNPGRTWQRACRSE